MIPSWWDGGQLAQTADAVLYKQQTMPDKSRMPALIEARGLRFCTPREWERMLGFPDDYTRISAKTADGPRYKALGNSMAVPVMRWLGERIAEVEKLL